MCPVRSRSSFATNVESVAPVTRASSELSSLAIRGLKLEACQMQVEEAERCLRRAHQFATESACHGLLYRLDRHLAKLKLFSRYISFKKGRIKARMEALRGN